MPLLLLKYWKFALIAVLMAGSAYVGYSISQNSWLKEKAKIAEKVKQLELENKTLEAKGNEVTIKEVTKYVDRIKLVEGATQTILKEVPVYVTQEDNDRCTINDGFVWVYNAAASNTPVVSEASRDPHASTTGVELSTVAETTTVNYDKYHKVAEQLKALQSWVLEQEKLWNKK